MPPESHEKAASARKLNRFSLRRLARRPERQRMPARSWRVRLFRTRLMARVERFYRRVEPWLPASTRRLWDRYVTPIYDRTNVVLLAEILGEDPDHPDVPGGRPYTAVEADLLRCLQGGGQ